MRIALVVEYDGRGFYGWQRQRDVPSIQATLEAALSAIADHPVTTIVAGRTDAGVHAVYQVVHFDTSAERPMRAWTFGVNSQLPSGVAVAAAVPVPDDFHARFSATARRYYYLLLNHPMRPALYAGRVYWECRPLNFEAMREAASHFIGERDFTSVRGQGCQAKSPVKRVLSSSLRKRDDLIIFDIEATGFLLHMVRNIVGVLVSVGLGREGPAWVPELLAQCDRSRAGVTAPPSGLYLAKINYPEKFAIPTGGSGQALNTFLIDPASESIA